MVQSIFEVFKMSLGPSSSHTTGPMLAAREFALALEKNHLLERVESLKVSLFGSLAATGIGHSTDKALILGFMGYTPDCINSSKIDQLLREQKATETLSLLEKKRILFKPSDLSFHLKHPKLFHPNTLKIEALDATNHPLLEETFYSLGGGKILSESSRQHPNEEKEKTKVPYIFSTAKELHSICSKNEITITQMVLENETALSSKEEVKRKLDAIMEAMKDSIHKGCSTTGILPGGLKVKRRAHELYEKLKDREKSPPLDDPTGVLDWVNLYALAVNEENASGAKIVTAPTNGAAGVIPAVLHYYKKHTKTPKISSCYDFLLTAGAIGILYMNKASISGAEVGCQGEVGVACSMAAAGLTAALGGSLVQIEKAAEIGMEHNLGLTCDPIGGLVQIPCIERNAMASIKAINASRLALVTNQSSHVSLDDVIKTMYQTGLDMKSSYKETSQGGLAVNVTNC